MTEAGYKSQFLTSKCILYLALTGELWDVFCEDLVESWPRYNSTVLYIPWITWITFAVFFKYSINPGKWRSSWKSLFIRSKYWDQTGKNEKVAEKWNGRDTEITRSTQKAQRSTAHNFSNVKQSSYAWNYLPQYIPCSKNFLVGPTLKMSWHSAHAFSRNVANKHTQTDKQTDRD